MAKIANAQTSDNGDWYEPGAAQKPFRYSKTNNNKFFPPGSTGYSGQGTTTAGTKYNATSGNSDGVWFTPRSGSGNDVFTPSQRGEVINHYKGTGMNTSSPGRKANFYVSGDELKSTKKNWTEMPISKKDAKSAVASKMKPRTIG